jgi:hypothetical protein
VYTALHLYCVPCAGLCSEADRVWCSVLLPHPPNAAAANCNGHSRRAPAGRKCSSSPASRRSAPWQGCACRFWQSVACVHVIRNCRVLTCGLLGNLLTPCALPSLQPNLSVPRRIAGNCPVHQHGYCRVHVHPKRFPLAYTADWQVCMHGCHCKRAYISVPRQIRSLMMPKGANGSCCVDTGAHHG